MKRVLFPFYQIFNAIPLQKRVTFLNKNIELILYEYRYIEICYYNLLKLLYNLKKNNA
jgi:hypothetical protein